MEEDAESYLNEVNILLDSFVKQFQVFGVRQVIDKASPEEDRKEDNIYEADDVAGFIRSLPFSVNLSMYFLLICLTTATPDPTPWFTQYRR